MMPKLIEVKPLAEHRLWVRYSDGVQGEVDLSDLAGKGVFAAWQQPGEFEKVSIGSGGELAWAGGTDLCPDTGYMRLTGKSPAELFPNLSEAGANA